MLSPPGPTVWASGASSLQSGLITRRQRQTNASEISSVQFQKVTPPLSDQHVLLQSAHYREDITGNPTVIAHLAANHLYSTSRHRSAVQPVIPDAALRLRVLSCHEDCYG